MAISAGTVMASLQPWSTAIAVAMVGPNALMTLVLVVSSAHHRPNCVGGYLNEKQHIY